MKLATLCYIKDDGKTLMIHRVKKENDMHHGKWNGLGGKLEPGETPEECVIREVEEECGLLIRNPQLKGLLTFPAFDGFDDWYVFVYVTTECEGVMIESEEGILKWIPDSDLLQLPLWDGDKIFLKWLDQKGFFSAKFVYKNGNLVDYDAVFYK
jgi:8-oxo-dGTP diphosphatase